MVLEEFVVIVRGHNGRGKRQFTYSVDPRKKPNAESVLKDFRLDSQIEDERHWRLCTLTGKEIRWLADYADRVLVLEPTNGRANAHNEAILPRLGTPSPKLIIRSQATSSNYELANNGNSPVIVNTAILENDSRRPRNHRSESSSILSTSSTPKLPSLSTSSGSGSNLLSSSGSGSTQNRYGEQRLSRVTAGLPKARDSRPGYAKSEHTGKRRERSR